MSTTTADLGELARVAQEAACEDPRRIAPELCWRRDARGWIAGKEARQVTKSRWGVRPDRVVCRPGYVGLYIHGRDDDRGLSWLSYLNGDVEPRGESFKRLLEELCERVGVPYPTNGGRGGGQNGKKVSPRGDSRRGDFPAGKRSSPPSSGRDGPPPTWPFNAPGARHHGYPGYWVCVLPGEDGTKKVLQYRIFEDGSVAPGLSPGRYWRKPGAVAWTAVRKGKKIPEGAEVRELPAVERIHSYRHHRVAGAIDDGEPVYFLEGERDVETAEALGLVADTNPGGAGKLTAAQAAPYRRAEVVVIPDHDRAGIEGAKRNAETLKAAGARVRLLDPLGGEPGSGFDFTDWIEELRREDPQGWRDRLHRELAERAEARKEKPLSVDILDFLAAELPPRQWIIRHLIQEKDITMIFARRGVGKTYAAQAIAWAVVTGTAWLRFEVESPTGVLYIDGEMPREDLHQRFAAIRAGAGGELVKPLRLVSEDVLDQAIPSLATAEGQAVIDAELAKLPEVGLVIIDAVTTLCHDPQATESDARSWDSMQSWLLSLRRRGIASLV